MAECPPWRFLYSRNQDATPRHVSLTAEIEKNPPLRVFYPRMSRRGGFSSFMAGDPKLR